MRIQGASFLLFISCVTSLIPLKTETVPTMEIFDEDHVLVDYDKSFVIQDFVEIKSISVYLANTTRNIAVATREDISYSVNKTKVWQELQKKTKLKGKLNPCEVNKFFVRLRFYGDPEYLDSMEGTYNPNLIMSDLIMSSICMENGILMLPLKMMRENSALLSKCLKRITLQEDNVDDISSISITNKHTGYTSHMTVNKKENQCSTQSSLLFVLVVAVLVIFVLLACGGVAWIVYKLKTKTVVEPIEITSEHDFDRKLLS